MLTPAPGQNPADAIGQAAMGFDPIAGPLTFLKHVGSDDIYHRGPEEGGIIIVVPGLWTSMPDDLLAALRSRRRASATGRCPECEAVVNIAAAAVHHEDYCVVSDDNLVPAITAWARNVGLYARGRRIVEDPA